MEQTGRELLAEWRAVTLGPPFTTTLGAMARNALAKFGLYLSDRRNFTKASTVMFGGPFAIGMLWLVGAVGGVGWWIFLVVLSLASGWLWGYLMWFVVKEDFERIAAADRRNHEGPTK